MMGKYLLFVIMLISFVANGQAINKNWKQDLTQDLALIKACDNSPGPGVSACNQYMGGALKKIYIVDDFYSKSAGRYMLTAEIASYLKNDKNWTLLGYGYEGKALEEAQQLANANKAAVAIYVNEAGLGQLAVIAPGTMKLSGTWGFQVPNSVSFFPNDKEKSYIDKPLSYAFSSNQIKTVLLYGRKN